MKKIVESKVFQVLVLIIILINAVVLGLQTSPEMVQNFGQILDGIDHLCLGLFVVELICKFIAYRFAFFKSGWNVIDLLIIVGSLVTTVDVISSMRIVRLCKEFRALRLVSSLKTMQIIVTAMVKSVPSLGYAGLLILMLYYIYAVIGVTLYGASNPNEFGSISNAFITLFQVMTGDSWSSSIMRPMLKVHPHAWLYMISFVILSAFIMLNIVVGIVVNFITDAYQKAGRISSSQTNALIEIEKLEESLKALKDTLK